MTGETLDVRSDKRDERAYMEVEEEDAIERIIERIDGPREN